MINIKFPSTDYVQCVFSYQTTSRVPDPEKYDEYGRYMAVASMKKYVYYVPEYLQGQLHVGDVVVVRCTTGYQICEVVETDAFTSYDSTTIAPVVAKVDFLPYIKSVRKAKQLKHMRKEIDKEKKRLESLVTYDLLAEKNPEFKAMLEAFKAAGGQL